ncbi:MAG: HPr kinase/phosphatase C-terminal domain-containing protein [Boseongicola sp.]
MLHASAIVIGSSGLLITGPSGAGKSSLALELMALGATLVADDRVAMSPSEGRGVMMTAPKALEGLVEARGLGLIKAPFRPARLRAVVDLATVEDKRLPELHETLIAGEVFPIFRKVESASFPAMLVAYLNGGLAAP